MNRNFSPRLFGYGGIYSLFFILQQLLGWPLLMTAKFKGDIDFADLRAVLNNVDCFPKVGWGIFKTQVGNPCFNYIYGSGLIRTFDWLHLNSRFTFFIGLLFLITFSFILAAITLTFRTKKYQLLFFLFIVVSPPTQLLLERANIDVIIYSLIFIAAIKNQISTKLVSFAMLAIATLYKFYTLPLLILSFCKFKKRFLFALSFPMIFVLLTIITDFTKLRSITVNNFNAAFGLPIWGFYLQKFDFQFSYVYNVIIGIFMVLLGIYVVKLVLRKSSLVALNLFLNVDSNDINERVSSMFILTFLGCFAVGMNYDYRLMFLTIGLAMQVQQMSTNKTEQFLILLSIALMSWLSYNLKVLQPIGDIVTFFWISFIVHSLVSEIKRYPLNQILGNRG